MKRTDTIIQSVYVDDTDDNTVSEAITPTDLMSRMDHDDHRAALVIPDTWEPDPQIQLPTLDMSNLSALSETERKRLCQDLLGRLQQSFKQLRDHAHVARGRIVEDGRNGLPATMARPAQEDDTKARLRALEALTGWYYQDGQADKETTMYMGAIASSRKTLTAIAELNRLKALFSLHLSQLKEALGDKGAKTELEKLYATLAPDAPQNVRRKVVGVMVRELLHKRLNIRQLLRQIPVVPATPDSIRWRWSLTPSTLRIHKSDLTEILEQKGETTARYDLQTLATEPGSWFSWHKGETEDCRISVYCATAFKAQMEEGQSALKSKNLGIKSRLPIFYLQPSEKEKGPDLYVVPEGTERLRRASKTEREPFLLSLPIHRYLEATNE